MRNIKPIVLKNIEFTFFFLTIICIIIHALLKGDSVIALISALCGITYTFWAGKGKPVCYLFGVLGSCFYCILSFKNALWGNLLLYAGYYVPMQIWGFFQWQKHLNSQKSEIIKTSLSKKEFITLIPLTTLAIAIFAFILIYFNDSNSLLDSATTILSIIGMYLTVRRAIEQWIFWMAVNLLSLIMWIGVAMSGARVYSTVIMWAVYLFLAVYFYISWKKELSVNK